MKAWAEPLEVWGPHKRCIKTISLLSICRSTSSRSVYCSVWYTVWATATSSSSWCSPGGPAAHKRCKRAPAQGCPRLSKHTGSTLSCLCDNHKPRCCWSRLMPPPEACNTETETESVTHRKGWKSVQKVPHTAMSNKDSKVYLYSTTLYLMLKSKTLLLLIC